MTRLLNLSRTFLKTVDNSIRLLFIQYSRDPLAHSSFILRLQHIRNQIDERSISSRIDYLIARIQTQKKTFKKHVEVLKDGKIIGVLCDNLLKPSIAFIRDETKIDCVHEFKTDLLAKDTLNNDNKVNNNIIDDVNNNLINSIITNNRDIKLKLPASFTSFIPINEILQLDELKGKTLFITLYNHSYRSFNGFTCLILICTSEKCYIIDTLEMRNLKHEIFYCHTMKYFHCEGCLKNFKREFGNLGCARFLNLKEDVYCDWRIRPLRKIMYDIIISDIEKCKESLCTGDAIKQKGIEDDTYDMNMWIDVNIDFIAVTRLFIRYFSICDAEFDLVYNLLKLRNFIAGNNNESPSYILTDSQLLRVIIEKPETADGFTCVLKRMSALAKEHMFDFILVIKNFRSDDSKPILNIDPELYKKED